MSATRERFSHGSVIGRPALAVPLLGGALLCGALLLFVSLATLGPSAIAKADRGGGGSRGHAGQEQGASQGQGEGQASKSAQGKGHRDGKGQSSGQAEQGGAQERGHGRAGNNGDGGRGNAEAGNAPKGNGHEGGEGQGSAYGQGGQGSQGGQGGGGGQRHGEGEGKQGQGEAKGSGNGRGKGRGDGKEAGARPEPTGDKAASAASDGSARTASAVVAPKVSAATTVQQANPTSSPAPASSAAPTALSTSASPAAIPARHVALARPHHRRRRGSRLSASTGLRSSSERALQSTFARAALPIVTSPAPARHVVRPAHRSLAQSALPPLARTITKIVGVVPPRVWILIGALFAMALASGARSLLAARKSRLLEHQRATLLEDVGLLQAALLPTVPARLGPVAASAAYRPAEGPGAGGDFYDVFALSEGKVAVVVGDVSGHGRGALPHTALVRYTLRAYLEAGLSPREAVKTGGVVLEHQLGELFVTALAATYDPRERTLVYASAGHPPPLVSGAKSFEPVIAASAAPIGIGARTGTRQTVLWLPGKARVCFHTDGVTETRVGSELYGAGRLERELAALDDDARAQTLIERVVDTTDARPDDMAVCLLAIEGHGGVPTVLLQQIELGADDVDSERTRQFLRACGVREAGIAAALPGAKAHAKQAGSVLIEVRYEDGMAKADWASDNVAWLHATGSRRAVGARASL